MVSVEIDSNYIGLAVGAFIIKQSLISPTADDDDESALPNMKTYTIQRVESRQEDGTRTLMTLGVGTFTFVYDSTTFAFTRKLVGAPVSGRSNDRDAIIHDRVILSGPTETAIHEFCRRAVAWQDSDIEDHFQTFSWNTQSEFWQRTSFAPKRTQESVVLEKSLTNDLMHDLEEFTSDATRSWYKRHCIPFRRGYLFYGPPGTGKTSMIAVIATHIGRGVHRVSLVAPRLTDDMLFHAVNAVQDGGVIVMEDIDSLFTTHREKKEEFGVTFSGLLNAIDGVGDPSRGIIFVFTTNHREQLDTALCRKGRIDRMFYFGPASKCIATRMFLRFYPNNADVAPIFARGVMAVSPPPTQADLQHHFIMHRTKSAEDASKFVQTADDIGTTVNMWT